MNKVCSFLIIIIIGYLSYNYCSKTVEGISPGISPGVNQGGYNLDQDRVFTPSNSGNQGAQGSCTPQQISQVGSACYYSNSNSSDCTAGINRDNYRYKDGNNAEREQCMRCVMNNKNLPIVVKYLAGIGVENGGSSEFARNYCDALMAGSPGCDNAQFYSIGETDFDNDCSGVNLISNNTKTTRALCTVMTNPVFEFLFEMAKGVVCDMNIRARMIERTIEDGIHQAEDTIEHLPVSIACAMSGGHVPGTDCPS